jgi:hypothetical protein
VKIHFLLQPGTKMSMDIHSVQTLIHDIPTWAQFAAQGIAAADTSAVETVSSSTGGVCAGIGDPNFDILCWIGNLNPFKIFDAFQGSVQKSVVGLHGLLEVQFITFFRGPLRAANTLIAP